MSLYTVSGDEVVLVGQNDQRDIVVPDGITCAIKGDLRVGGHWGATLRGHCLIGQSRVVVDGVNFMGGLELAGTYLSRFTACGVSGGDLVTRPGDGVRDPNALHPSTNPSALDFVSLHVGKGVGDVWLQYAANYNFFGGAFERWGGVFSISNDDNIGPVTFWGTRFEHEQVGKPVHVYGDVQAHRPTIVCAHWTIDAEAPLGVQLVNPTYIDGARLVDHRPRVRRFSFLGRR